VIFVDSNIPTYLIGAEHPNKDATEAKLDELIRARECLVTDVQVQQEILHRYVAIERREAIQPAFDVLLAIVDEVFPIEPQDAARAKALVLERRTLSPREAIHAATMERHGVSRILSFDRGFDGVPGIRRV